MNGGFLRDLVRLLALTLWFVAALALALFMLSACVGSLP